MIPLGLFYYALTFIRKRSKGSAFACNIAKSFVAVSGMLGPVEIRYKKLAF